MDLIPCYPHACDYMDCPTEMDLIDPADLNVSVGRAKRCGITRPGYVARGTYTLTRHRRPVDGVFVYDAGRFVEANEWHADPANLKPADEPKPKRGRKTA